MFFGRSDHCHQWFYDGFLMLLPSLSMVFDGSGPLVKRCNGFDGSLWSKLIPLPIIQPRQSHNTLLFIAIELYIFLRVIQFMNILVLLVHCKENLGENLEKRLPRPPTKIQARSTSDLVFINLPKVGNISDL